MAQSVLCGSCIIGDGAAISPGAVIRDKVTVGDGAHIGLGAVVVRNVSAGEVVAGVPARPLSSVRGPSKES
jgi:acetyltransferase-like isoleucine patch superfamily enzyme